MLRRKFYEEASMPLPKTFKFFIIVDITGGTDGENNGCVSPNGCGVCPQGYFPYFNPYGGTQCVGKFFLEVTRLFSNAFCYL